MTFDAYIENITKKTGKPLDEIRDLLKEAGVLTPGVKATPVVNWLKENLELGHGHAMAIVKWLREHGEMA